MKKYIILFVLMFSLLFSTNGTLAQSTPPANHGISENQSGGGAPIGGGLFILLGLSAAYGGKKIYNHRKNVLEE